MGDALNDERKETNPWREESPVLKSANPPSDNPAHTDMQLPEDVGDTSVWSNSHSNYRPQYVAHAQTSNVLDEFDPFASNPPSPTKHNTEHAKSEAHGKGLEPSGGLLSQPLLPSLSLSSITNVFRRVTPSTSPAPPSSPAPEMNATEDEEKGGAVKEKASDLPAAGPSKPKAAPNRPSTRHPKEKEEDEFDYTQFMDQMHTRQADPISKYVRSFMQNFAKRQLRTSDQVQIVNNFLDFIAEKMRTNEIWRDASEREFDNAIEGMEKLVMSRIYHLTFTPALAPELASNNPTDDLERDQVLTQRIRLFGWVTEKHLDLPCDPQEQENGEGLASATSSNANPTSVLADSANLPVRASGSKSAIKMSPSGKSRRKDGKSRQDYLDDAQREILRINQFRAPRDKLITILNCCIIIFNLIRANGEDGGADTFVPYLILIILKACPEHLLSNIQYIQRFRNPEKLQGESGYYLQSLLGSVLKPKQTGAIAFIETMDHSSLSNITQDEFEHHMEQAICEMEPDLPQPPALPPAQDSATPLSPNSVRMNGHPQRPGEKDVTYGARDFFERSAGLAQSAVSKPLNAIGKIFTEIGTSQQQQTPQLNDPTSPSSQFSPTENLKKKRGYSGSAYNTGSPPASPIRPSFASSSSAQALKPGDFVPDDLAPAAIQAQIDSAASEHQAKLSTLEAMFPAIDTETREVILISFQNDLGAAVDALLEMGDG